jgi:glycerol-3-phosphate dehydrogenase (NAD(P)+)
VTTLTTQRENIFRLPGIRLGEGIQVTGDPEKVREAGIVLLTVPAQQMRQVTTYFSPYLNPQAILIICSKGIEKNTLFLMTEVLQETLPHLRRAVISGPNFAQEVGRNLPTAISLAVDPSSFSHPAEALPTATSLLEALGSLYFRPYASDDVIGVQMAGALKNVIAIACGIVKGRALGENARAAVITRGLSEIMQLGVKKGAKVETFFGLAGVGDLTLTCCSDHSSRNTNLGASLGEGIPLDVLLSRQKTLTEGVYTSDSAHGLARKLGVEAPLIESVHKILSGESTINMEISQLLSRPYKIELPNV